jgi:hypothetical protein
LTRRKHIFEHSLYFRAARLQIGDDHANRTLTGRDLSARPARSQLQLIIRIPSLDDYYRAGRLIFGLDVSYLALRAPTIDEP